MVFWIAAQFVLGIVLIAIGGVLRLARHSTFWKRLIEKAFLEPGDDLFAKDQPYSGYVKWIRYTAFPTGLVILIPTPIVVEFILGMVAAGVYWWMHLQKAKHDDYVHQSEQSKANKA